MSSCQDVTTPVQDELDLEPTELELATDVVLTLLRSRQPSAWELVDAVETKVDITARWLVPIVLKELACDDRLVSAPIAWECSSPRI
jgi:hypothetical protein